jgi:hypothetical protein
MDFLFQVIIAYLIFSFSRNKYIFLLVQILLMSFIYLGSAIKNSFLGSPISISDILSLSALFNIIDSFYVILIISPFLIFIIVFLFNFKINNIRSYISLAIISLLCLIIYLIPQEIQDKIYSIYNYEICSPDHNMYKSGGTIYFIQQISVFLAETNEDPKRNEVESALNGLDINNKISSSNLENFTKRNVYVIVIESLWDPYDLKNVSFTEDPWDRDFRGLWSKTNKSTAMSPVFGGFTADSEFEILTGQPSNLFNAKVMFTSSIRNDIPALPALFSEYGYETFAFHPYIKSFWNRYNAYSKLGFNHYYSINDFILDDVVKDGFLSDNSLFKQSMELVSKNNTEKPNFVYILTLAEHYPYYNNSAKRPDIIRTNSSIPTVEAYANMLRYSTLESMNFVEEIIRNDRDALIVITGDHLPILGRNFSAFVEAGLFADSTGKFDARMYSNYASVPLIIIDGENGPIDTGKVSMFEIPAIILRLLNFPSPGFISIFSPPDNLKIRPYPGVSLVVDDSESLMLCKNSDKNGKCGDVSDWIENITILEKDILSGEQISINKIQQMYSSTTMD